MTSIGIGDAETLLAADYNFKDFTEISLEFLSILIEKKIP
jgi:beta-phosphoglucomutase